MDFPTITWANGSRQPSFIIVTAILVTLSLCTVSLRLYCRIGFIKHVGIDDYFIVVALCITIALAIMNGFHISYGTGLHVTDLSPNLEVSLIPTLKYWYAYQIIYPLTLFFVKASILALYWRIFNHTTWHRWWIIATAVVVATYTVIVMFVNTFECHGDVSQAWSPTFPQGCNDLPASYFSMAGINIATDLIILLLPIHPLSKLNVNRRRRNALVAIFLVGSFAVIASGVRLYSIWIYLKSKDVSYDAIFILLWSQVELNIAIVCASIPPLRPLFAMGIGTTVLYSQSSHELRHNRSPHGRVSLSMGKGRLARSERRSGGTELYSMSKSGRGSEMKGTVFAQPRDVDNESEEFILGDAAKYHITRTIKTEVRSQPRRDLELESGHQPKR